MESTIVQMQSTLFYCITKIYSLICVSRRVKKQIACKITLSLPEAIESIWYFVKQYSTTNEDLHWNKILITFENINLHCKCRKINSQILGRELTHKVQYHR